MPGLNKAIVGGYVARDPEVRRLGNGDPVVNLSIPTSEKWKDKNTGEAREKTQWHNIVCFNERLCGIIEQYVHKGSQIVVVGEMQTRKWQDQSGVERYTTEIVLPRFGGEVHLMGESSGGGGRDRQYSEEQEGRYSRRTGSANDSGQGELGMTRRDSHIGGPAPLERRSAPSSGGGSKYGDIDDDIPF